MQLMQTRTLTIVQDIQKNVTEMYLDWKSIGGFSGHTENDTKWIEVRIWL